MVVQQGGFRGGSDDVTLALPTSDTIQTLTFNVVRRYVRVERNPNSDAHYAFSQIVINDQNGNNLAQGRGAQATATYSGSNPATPIDGVLAVRDFPSVWHNVNAGDVWEIDLGKPQRISTIVIYARAGYTHRIMGMRVTASMNGGGLN